MSPQTPQRPGQPVPRPPQHPTQTFTPRPLSETGEQQQPPRNPQGAQNPQGERAAIRPMAEAAGDCLATIPPSIVPPEVTGAGEAGIAAFGTLIQVLSDLGPPRVFTTIAGVGDIARSGPTTDVVDTTNHSTATAFKSFAPGGIDPGQLTFPVFFNPADPTHAAMSPFGLENLLTNRVTTQFRIVKPDSGRTTHEFYGFVQSLSEAYPVAGVMTRDVTIQILGPLCPVFPMITVPPSLAPTVGPQGLMNQEITIAAPADVTLSWTVFASVPWLRVTSPVAPVFGGHTIRYDVLPNETPNERQGFLMIADQRYTITQEGTTA
jgi:hypothetical protein